MNYQLGNHFKAISLMQAFIERYDVKEVPSVILFLYLRSLVAIDEKLYAFTLLSKF